MLLKQTIPLAILWILSTILSIFAGPHQINYLVLGLLLVTPIVFFSLFHRINKDSDLLLVTFFLATLLSAIFHQDSFRISTLLYTFLYIVLFICYEKFIHDGFLTVHHYSKTLKTIVVAYFVVLVIQQFCVFFNLPFIFNFIAGDTRIMKLNALGPEPSHSARFVLVAFLSFLISSNITKEESISITESIKQHKFTWTAFVYTMITMGSGFSMVLLFIFLLRFLRIRVSFKQIFSIFLFCTVMIFILYYSEFEPIIRVKSFAKALISLDPKLLMSADHSASVRIVPIIAYFQNFSLMNINYWIGYGTDYTVNLVPTIMPGVPQGSLAGGFFPAFFFDRGLIPAIIILLFFKKYCLIKFWAWDNLIFVLSIFEVGINTQLFWFIVFVYFTNKYFLQKKIESASNLQEIN